MAPNVPDNQPPILIPKEERIIPPRLRNPHEPKPPEPPPISVDAANIASFWANTTWLFYLPNTDGQFRIVDEAEYIIDANLNVIMIQYSGETDYSTGCTESVRNDYRGILKVHPTTPQTFQWLEFDVSGEEIWTNTCPPPGSQNTYPLAPCLWGWHFTPLDPYGRRFEFFNGNYPVGKWFRDFVVHRIR